MLKILTSDQDYFSKISNGKSHNVFTIFHPEKIDSIHNDLLFNKAIEHIRFPNGTYKTTIINRFSDIDGVLLDLLDSFKGKQLLWLDVGASDGSTTVALQEVFKKNGFSAKAVATDLFLRILVQKNPLFTNYYDEDARWIFSTSGFAYFSFALPSRFFLSKLGSYLFNWVPLVRIDKAILLVCPSARLNSNELNIEFVRHNLFLSFSERFSHKFNFIRCMNILNPKYFTNDELKNAIDNLFNALEDSGIIQVGRTDVSNGKNNLSFIKKESNHWKVVQRVNEGSEIEYLFENRFNVNNQTYSNK